MSPVQESSGFSPVLVTANQVATMLQVSVRTVWRLKSSGKLPKPVEFGGSVRWNVEVIRKWIESGCPEVVPMQLRTK